MSGDVAIVIGTLEKLAETGVGIALDDFGTGYSSLNNVHLLPITSIKVDRSFVDRVNERKGNSMLKTIAAMAYSLDVVTIAEGIEDQSQYDELLRLGYTLGQGFLFNKAQPADIAEQLIERNYLSS